MVKPELAVNSRISSVYLLLKLLSMVLSTRTVLSLT